MNNELLQVGLPPEVMAYYKEMAKGRYQKLATVVRDVLVDHYNRNKSQQAEGQENKISEQK